MQAVFGLVKDDRLRAIHHRIGDFLVPVRGQAVHEQRVWLCLGHQRFVHLIGPQLVVAAFAGGLAVVHRNPCIRHDKVGTHNGLVGVPLDLNRDTFGASPVEEDLFGIQRLGTRKG